MIEVKNDRKAVLIGLLKYLFLSIKPATGPHRSLEGLIQEGLAQLKPWDALYSFPPQISTLNAPVGLFIFIVFIVNREHFLLFYLFMTKHRNPHFSIVNSSRRKKHTIKSFSARAILGLLIQIMYLVFLQHVQKKIYFILFKARIWPIFVSTKGLKSESR